MAAIRLEDEARTDPRFRILGKRLGTTRFDAIGRMAELWAYCTEKQTYFLSVEIIDELAEVEGFAKLIVSPDIGLAEASDKGIRIKGTRGRIEWLKKLRNSSKKGGQKTRAKWQAKRLAKEGPEVGPNEGAITLAPALTLAPAITNKTKKENTSADPSGSSAPKGSSIATWESYRDAYQKRYGAPPIRNATINGQLSNLVKRLGEDSAPHVAEFYLTHQDPRYVRAMHPVGLLLLDAEKLHTEWVTKRNVTTVTARPYGPQARQKTVNERNDDLDKELL